MIKRSLLFAWLAIVLCWAAGSYALIYRPGLLPRPAWIMTIGALGILLACYTAIRLFIFRRRLVRFANKIIAGEYETGIKAHRFWRDEVAELTRLLNRAADRLGQYDMLRAQKVAINTRARDVMFARAGSPVVIADMDERIFHFNAAAQALFAIEQEEMSFSSIENRPENAAFVEFFRDTVEREKVQREADLAITIPIRATTRELHALIVPIKDREENVGLALIFLQ